MDKKTTQKMLSEKFVVEDVKQRDGGFGKKLDYIPINVIIDRVTEVLPLGYSWIIEREMVVNDSFMVVGRITIQCDDGLLIFSGIGADKIGSDFDKTCKTADAEAFKKAWQYGCGMGNYLWDAEERAEIARERQNGGVVTKRTFSSQQIEKMKFIRLSLKLTTDADLNALLKCNYKNTSVNSKADLTPENIDDFFTWAETILRVPETI
jgi:hypothetical protein